MHARIAAFHEQIHVVEHSGMSSTHVGSVNLNADVPDGSWYDLGTIKYQAT